MKKIDAVPSTTSVEFDTILSGGVWLGRGKTKAAPGFLDWVEGRPGLFRIVVYVPGTIACGMAGLWLVEALKEWRPDEKNPGVALVRKRVEFYSAGTVEADITYRRYGSTSWADMPDRPEASRQRATAGGPSCAQAGKGSCSYSRSMNQAWPRKCVKCGVESEVDRAAMAEKLKAGEPAKQFPAGALAFAAMVNLACGSASGVLAERKDLSTGSLARTTVAAFLDGLPPSCTLRWGGGGSPAGEVSTRDLAEELRSL
jgi:hypothetical protein